MSMVSIGSLELKPKFITEVNWNYLCKNSFWQSTSPKPLDFFLDGYELFLGHFALGIVPTQHLAEVILNTFDFILLPLALCICVASIIYGWLRWFFSHLFGVISCGFEAICVVMMMFWLLFCLIILRSN